MTLVNQPSKMPTRKMAAVFIATVVVNAAAAGIQSGINFFLPEAFVELPTEQWIDTVVYWITVGGPLAAGYFTKERG